MKKIISLILAVMLLASVTCVMVACDDSTDGVNEGNNGGDNTTPDTPDTPDAPETPDNRETPDNNENPDDNETPVIPEDPEDPEIPDHAAEILGVKLADGVASSSVTVPAKTESVVYLVISEQIEGLYAELYRYSDKSTISVSLTDLGYSEADAGYVLSFTVPANEEGTSLTLKIRQEGTDLYRTFLVSVSKKLYVDPNGTMPA